MLHPSKTPNPNTHPNRSKKARECAYGKTPGATANCTNIVQPGEGVQYSYSVFCSEEHAALDQAEQLL